MFDDDDGVADAMLLLPLIENEADRRRWLDALGKSVLGRDAPCDDACIAEVGARVSTSSHPGIQLALSDQGDEDKMLRLLREARRGTDAERDRAAVFSLRRAIITYAASRGADFGSRPYLLLRPWVCDPPVELASGPLSDDLRACAEKRSLPSFEDETLRSSNATAIALFAQAVHQMMERVRAGHSRLTRTLVESGLLEQQLRLMNTPLELPVFPSWVSSTPLTVDGPDPRDYASPSHGFIIHVQRSATLLRALPTLMVGEPVPRSFPPARPMTEETWNAARAQARARVESIAAVNATEPEETPEWLNEGASTETAARSPLEECARVFDGLAASVTLVVDQDAPVSELLSVLRLAAEEPTRVTWIATQEDDRDVSESFLLGPADESSRDCSEHLNLTTTSALYRQLGALDFNRQVTLHSE